MEDLIVNAFFDKSFDSTFFMGPHGHPSIEIMFCKEGSFDVAFYDKNGVEISCQTIAPNTYIIIQENSIHKLIIRKNQTPRIYNFEISRETSNEKEAIIHFDLNRLIQTCKGVNSLFNNKSPFYVVLDDGSFYRIFKDYIFLATNNKKTQENDLRLQLLKYEILVLLSEVVNNNEKPKFGIKYINNAISYLNDNFDKKITIDDVAEHVGINKTYLQKLFKTIIGKSVIDYLNEFRISRCREVLMSTNTPLSKLHESCGFESRQSLLYNFKKYVGVSPLLFKKGQDAKMINFEPNDEYKNKCYEIKEGK